jgi:hypothetical protein
VTTSLSTLAIIAAFPFFLLTLLEAKGSIGPIFIFFLGDFLGVFLVLRFYREPVIRISSKDIDLLDSKSSPLASRTLPLNRNELYSIFILKPLISLKGNN